MINWPEAGMNRINISQVDVLFSNGRYPIEFLFYYKSGFETKALRRALRKISSVFWPVFGEYHDGLISFDKYREDDCYAEEIMGRELDASEVEENPSEILSRFRLPDVEKLFFLKVVRFENGMAVIPKLSHVAGDGYSYFYLLTRLAMATRRARVPFKSALAGLFSKPNHRRTILRDFAFRGMTLEPDPKIQKFSIESDEIPRKEVITVIKEAASSHDARISTNDVLSAMAIKKLTGKRDRRPEEDVSLTMPIDVRRQIKEYGPKFFGNGLMFHEVKFKPEHIAKSSILEIAVDIRKSMPAVSKEAYINYLAGLEETIAQGKTDELRPFDPDRGCLVTNLTKLPTDQLDFGTGLPDFVAPLSIEKNSTALLAKGGTFILRFAY
jgi:hypothetical protein